MFEGWNDIVPVMVGARVEAPSLKLRKYGAVLNKPARELLLAHADRFWCGRRGDEVGFHPDAAGPFKVGDHALRSVGLVLFGAGFVPGSCLELCEGPVGGPMLRVYLVDGRTSEGGADRDVPAADEESPGLALAEPDTRDLGSGVWGLGSESEEETTPDPKTPDPLLAEKPAPAIVAAAAGTFGEQLKARRLQIGMSQGKLAEVLGVHQTRISSWERGESDPPSAAEVMLRLEDYVAKTAPVKKFPELSPGVVYLSAPEATDAALHWAKGFPIEPDWLMVSLPIALPEACELAAAGDRAAVAMSIKGSHPEGVTVQC